MCDHAETIPVEGLTAHPPETVPIVAVVGWRCVNPDCRQIVTKEDK